MVHLSHYYIKVLRFTRITDRMTTDNKELMTTIEMILKPTHIIEMILL